MVRFFICWVRVAHVVESRKQSRNQDLETVRDVRQLVLLQPPTRRNKIGRLRGRGGVGLLGLPIEDGVDGFAEPTAVQFGREPSPLKEILDDVAVLREERIAEAGWYRFDRHSVPKLQEDAPNFATHIDSPRFVILGCLEFAAAVVSADQDETIRIVCTL
jgi:hypothetical protein